MQRELSLFEYLYRDGGNFKTYGQLILTGDTAGAEEAIRRCLDWGDQFVAEQVGVPALCREHWDSVGEGLSELDHAYHEFAGIRPVVAGPTGVPLWGAVAKLVTRFERSARRWDVTMSANVDW